MPLIAEGAREEDLHGLDHIGGIGGAGRLIGRVHGQLRKAHVYSRDREVGHGLMPEGRSAEGADASCIVIVCPL